MLLKPIGAVPHEGKKVFDVGSRPYNLIHQWIKEGVKRDSDVKALKPTKLEILPKAIDLDLPGREQQLIVLAHYAVTDRMAEAHAMVSLVEQGWANQIEVGARIQSIGTDGAAPAKTTPAMTR